MFTQRQAIARKGTHRASHGPRVKAKERVRRARQTENPKENPKSSNGSYKGKTSKTGLSGLETPKSETS